MDALYNIEGLATLLNDMLENRDKTAISVGDTIAMTEGLLSPDHMKSYLDIEVAFNQDGFLQLSVAGLVSRAIRGDMNIAVKLHEKLCPETEFCVYKDSVRLSWDIMDDQGEYLTSDEVYYEHHNIARALMVCIFTYLVRKEGLSGKVYHDQGYFTETVKSLDRVQANHGNMFYWLLCHADPDISKDILGEDSLENFKIMVRQVVEYQTRDLVAAIKPTIFRTDITGEESARLGDAYLNFINNGVKLQ